MIDRQKLSEELKRDEGFRGCVYECSAGKKTIGYGHNIEDVPIPERIAEQLLDYDMANCIAQCERWAWFHGLDGIRQRAIVNMVFNIGWSGVSRFSRMIAAIERGQYDVAADEMKDSLWYNQVGARAERLVKMMREGRAD